MGEGKVLVEVHAASVNPVDTIAPSGFYARMMPLAFPATLGTDLAGEVVEVGPGVKDFRKGDKVCGMASLLEGANGAFAQYATVPAGMIARIPGGLTLNEAAALPPHKILIHGGAGGVGTNRSRTY